MLAQVRVAEYLLIRTIVRFLKKNARLLAYAPRGANVYSEGTRLRGVPKIIHVTCKVTCKNQTNETLTRQNRVGGISGLGLFLNQFFQTSDSGH